MNSTTWVSPQSSATPTNATALGFACTQATARVPWCGPNGIGSSRTARFTPSVSHAAFKVSDLAKAIEDRVLLLGPYEPILGFHVAVIDDRGNPIELIETSLTDDEIWKRARQQTDLTGRP
jgi:hypothetical protein